MATILIIDDSITVRFELSGILTEAGHVVVEAGNGDQALERFRETPEIALIICDYNMPGGLNGLDTLEIIYAECGEKRPASFMLSTDASATLKDRGRKIGLTGWMLKPFNGDNVVKVVTEVLNRAGA